MGSDFIPLVVETFGVKLFGHHLLKTLQILVDCTTPGSNSKDRTMILVATGPFRDQMMMKIP